MFNIVSIVTSFATLLGVLVACVALIQQRREMKRSAKFDMLSSMARIVELMIAEKQRLIADFKAKGNNYTSQTSAVNKELNPLLKQLHSQMLKSFADYKTGIDVASLRRHIGDDTAPDI